MARGKHIVLEGPDASGKKTQSRLLTLWLTERLQPDANVMRVAFPRYETPFGKLVSQYLQGESPSADPYYASLLYAADRAAAVPSMRMNLEEGTWIICDRYVESNRAHQVARAKNAKEREKLAQWITDTEYETLGNPKADLTILLNVPFELCHVKAASRREAENGKADIHEQDIEHLRLSWEQYQLLAKKEGWPVVECSADGKELLPREEIAAKIQAIVTEAFL